MLYGAHDAQPKQVSQKENTDPLHACDGFPKISVKLMHMYNVPENPF